MKVIIIKEYKKINGKVWVPGTEVEVTRDFADELAKGGYIETERPNKSNSKTKKTKE